ncbi:hypothetical protein niasHT_038252 [Heterodera trifolii]|uniref:Uncharacterized protein n=1 Tax=Heterodera trifolii TaxID=157864 RepID=A0ABD2IDB5_9BILA
MAKEKISTKKRTLRLTTPLAKERLQRLRFEPFPDQSELIGLSKKIYDALRCAFFTDLPHVKVVTFKLLDASAPASKEIWALSSWDKIPVVIEIHPEQGDCEQLVAMLAHEMCHGVTSKESRENGLHSEKEKAERFDQWAKLVQQTLGIDPWRKCDKP